jgi:hypothetical protein
MSCARLRHHPAMISELTSEQVAGHHHALDLVGSLVDLGNLSANPSL